ncbi:MAG: vWA domain-containing protein [Sandaracinus sp.]
MPARSSVGDFGQRGAAWRIPASPTKTSAASIVATMLAGALIASCLVGCGAKTGLEVPDAAIDAALDARSVDAGVPLDSAIPCIELLPDAGPVELPLDTQVEVGRADVVFLVDVTASMDQEIEQIKTNLRDRLAPGIRDTIPDARLGVATFADFPVPPCGDPGDLPFVLNLPVTDDVARVQAAVSAIETAMGRDQAEAQVEGLYQLATGEGRGSFVPPSFGCPSGGFGYPCFREDALPVVLLFTDAPFHDGPSGSNPYECALPVRPARYSEAVDALTARGVRVMGLYSGVGDGRDDLEAIARDTGAVDSGNPIVFDIGESGTRLSEGVIQSIRTLASVIELDIDVVLVDPVPGDGVDPREFVARVTPLRADPMSGVGEIDTVAGVFRRVRTGTRVVFQLELRNDAVAPGVGPQRFALQIVFRGDGRQRLDARTIEIVVPGLDGSGC